jgi:ATP/ADP translocase
MKHDRIELNFQRFLKMLRYVSDLILFIFSELWTNSLILFLFTKTFIRRLSRKLSKLSEKQRRKYVRQSKIY